MEVELVELEGVNQCSMVKVLGKNGCHVIRKELSEFKRECWSREAELSKYGVKARF